MSLKPLCPFLNQDSLLESRILLKFCKYLIHGWCIVLPKLFDFCTSGLIEISYVYAEEVLLCIFFFFVQQNHANTFAFYVSVQVCCQEILPSINSSRILPRPMRPPDDDQDVLVCQNDLLHKMWNTKFCTPTPLSSCS